MFRKKFDVAILGGGPGGYPAAIKLAQAGKSVALIEAKEVGGTCLNRGCIPTKALISYSEVLHSMKRGKEFGISVGDVKIDYPRMSTEKDSTVKKLRNSLEGLLLANGIEIVRGFGKLTAPNEIKVTGEESGLISAEYIIIATGSEPKEIGAFPFDHKNILSSTSILELTTLPKSLVVVGGGVIGCEFASLFHELGVKVSIVEMLPRILPLECETISQFITGSFQKRGIDVVTGAAVQGIDKTTVGITVNLKDKPSIHAEMALVAIGRALNSDKIGLEVAGVKVDRGAVVVDDAMRTNIPGLYAIGDITFKQMYAHTATHQGLVAAADILGETLHIDYDAIPGVTFTHPEIGSVGMSLETALKRGFKAKRTSYPYQALGKAQASKETEGFAQVVIEEGTGRILGAQIVGHDASNLIQPMALAIANELTCESVAETVHAHPTLAEIWMETSLLALGTPIHYPPLPRRA